VAASGAELTATLSVPKPQGRREVLGMVWGDMFEGTEERKENMHLLEQGASPA
jgi:hypothetical protein